MTQITAPPDLDAYIKVAEAAALLRKHPKTVRNMLAAGDIEAYQERPGARYYTTRRAIKAYMDRHKLPTAPRRWSA